MQKQLPVMFFMFFTVLLIGQQKNDQPAPKVGLVLSGGGAKGFAHIGAIRVIEEAGVKIDYIGGTSMGAIVGALYASGYSGKELDSIFRNTDFLNLIQNNLPRDAKTFYEKEDSERYALTLPFNNFKISFPSGISSGENIYNELVRLLYHVKDTRDFNELPIPFFCIATNVETGEEILLNQGFLPAAVLASGTLPSLFEPTEIEEQILIDGGVVNNYPIDELRAMGANKIIGIDVQHGLSNRESLLSATEILLQVNNYRTVKDMEKKSEQTDIYIKPDIQGFSLLDFNLAEDIIKKGRIAASDKYVELKELAIQQKDKRQVEKNPFKVSDSIKIDRLIIKGNNNYTRGYVKGKLRLNTDEKITFKKLQEGISNLSATGNFKAIRYEFVSNDNKVYLILNLKENTNKTFIRTGLHFDNLYKSAAIINLTHKNLFFKDDVGSFDFILGDNIRYNLQYYIDKGASSYWSFGVNSKFTSFDREINYNLIASNFDSPNIENVNTINIDVSDLTNQAYIQTELKEEFAVTLGVEHKLLKYSTKTLGNNVGGLPLNSLARQENSRTFFDKSNYYSTYGKIVLDTYNDKYFPTQGVYFSGDFHFYIASSDFNNNFKEFSITKGKLGSAFPLFRNVSMNVEAEGGFKLGISPVGTFDFLLGGYGATPTLNMIPFVGYDFISDIGNSYLKVSTRVDYEFAPKNHLLLTANYANVDDDLYRTGDWFKAPTFSGYAIGYGWESFLGPVQALYSWSPEISQNTFFFSIGYSF